MSTESELYNLKMKILRSKHISDQLREELANDVFEIESSIKAKNNEVLDPVMLSPEQIAKQMGWDSYYEMMLNEDHIESITKGAVNMIFRAYKLKVPFD